MPSGLLIRHSPTSRPFWYPCGREQIKKALAEHLTHWGRFQEVENGEAVTKTVDPKTLLCSFCSNRIVTSSGESYSDPESIDATITLSS